MLELTYIRNRRAALAGITSAAITFLSACSSDSKPSSIASLTSNDQIHQAIKELLNAVSELESHVEDFGTMNWREVVPDVKDSTEAVVAATYRLRQALQYSD